MKTTIKHTTRTLLRLPLLVAMALMVTNCTEVANIEACWNTSKLDPQLTGIWKSGDGSICAFVKTDKDYHVGACTNGMEGGIRTFETNGHQYMVINDLKASTVGYDRLRGHDKGGTLLKYAVKGDVLTIYALDPNDLASAIKAGKVAGEVNEDGMPNIKELDAATIKWLGQAAETVSWNESIYKKQK